VSTPRPEGITGSLLKGPFPVGSYAVMLQAELKKRSRVQLFGEVWGFKVSKARAYFELRDATGAVACSMWRNEFEALRTGPLADGAQVVVAGGPAYYPGSRTSSPHFSFDVSALRLAGEGDLLAQLDRLRKQLDLEGLFAPQKRLPRATLPRTIGVVTGEGGKARDDVLAGLRRRGWGGTVVWAFAPVQDRHAAPAITRALQDLAACGEVEVIVVARGGGSLADLFCFCDETLCRTVALLPVPVIASVGHHTDRTLMDDVAAASCSTPTHAAETAVPFHCEEARAALSRCAARLAAHGHRAVLDRARVLSRLSRAPAQHVAKQRTALHQSLRELRAAGRRGVTVRQERAARHALVLARKSSSTQASGDGAATLERLRLALAAHDPERTLERGYALVEDGAGGVVTSAAAARAAGTVRLRFSDAAVAAKIEEAGTTPAPAETPDPTAEVVQ
jgi:exodeoxyribonuclease VII large subunit